MICLDANVWIYFLDTGLDEHERVHDAVEGVLQSTPLLTTTVLQMEVIHYLTNQVAESDAYVETILSAEDTTVAELQSDDIARAAELLAEHQHAGIGGRDATVLAAMERHDVTRLWTHDEGLSRIDQRLDWLDVTDPVTER
jgi:predicted nucleic acid-binding protein